MTTSEETLIAYVDGELTDTERAAFEQALAADADLRARLDALRAFRTRLSAAFDPTLNETVPDRLSALLNNRKDAEIVDFAAKRAQRPRWAAREWGALAACTIIGLLVGVGVMRGGDAALVAAGENGLVARGALAHALDTQLAADEGRVRIGLSFVSRDGDLCRTFMVTSGGPAGFACKDRGAWRIPLATEPQPVDPKTYQQAATPFPPEVLAAVEARIKGEVFDAQQEVAARARHWSDAP